MRVVLLVHEPVARFLADEVAHLGCEQGVDDLVGRNGAQAVDEHFLADGKTHRQRIEQRRAVGIAAEPVPAESLGQVDLELADDQCGHGDAFNGGSPDYTQGLAK